MKTAIIHFFSGTGNTQHAAELTKKVLESEGYSCALINSDFQNGTLSPEAGLEVFMFPVYGFAVPKSMLRYMKSLRLVKGIPAAIISVGGTQGKDEGFAGASVYQAEALLKKKGYEVFFIDFVSYPENWTLVFNPSSEKVSANVFSKKDVIIEGMAGYIASGRININKCSRFNLFWSRIASVLFRSLGSRIMGKVIIADAKCNSCRLCEKTCPSRAIRMSGGKPRWNWQCQQCNRCVNICPQKSIQTSVMRLVLILLTIPASIAGVLAMPEGMLKITGIGIIDTIYIIVLITAVHLLLCYAVDKLAFLLEKLPVIRKLFEASFTKNYRRYTAPGYKPVKREI